MLPLSYKKCLLGLLALFVVCSSISEAANIRFRPQATINSSLIRLGDIAEVIDTNEDTVTKLEEMMLMPGPIPGQKMRLDFQIVRSRLQAVGVDLSQVQFSGSSVVLVARPGVPKVKKPLQKKPTIFRKPKVTILQRKRAQRLLAEAVRQHLRGVAAELGNVDVKVQLQDDDVPLVLSGDRSGYKITGGQSPWNRPQHFTAHFLNRKEEVQQVQTLCEIRPQPDVLAIKFNVPRGHVIKPSDLIWKQVEEINNRYTDWRNLVGMETTRPLRQNEVVNTNDVHAIPLVRTNEIVTVFSRVGNIVVKRQMKSRSTGSKDDLITLHSLSGRETLQARITGYHEAEVVGSDEQKPAIQQVAGSRIEFRSPQRTATNSRERGNYRSEHRNRKRQYTGIVQANHSHVVTNRPLRAVSARPIQPPVRQFIPEQLPAARNIKPISDYSPLRRN